MTAIHSFSHTYKEGLRGRHRMSEDEWHWTTDLCSDQQEANVGAGKNFEATINIRLPKSHGLLLCAIKTFRVVCRPLEYWFPNC
jgi:hypothetical protein